MTTEIASLVVKLGVDADSDSVRALDNSLGGAEQSAGGASRAMAGFAKGLAAVATAAVGAAVAVVKIADGVAKAGDEIAKNSRSLGISTEAYQRQKFALDLAGVSQAGFEKGTKKLKQELFRARQGEVTPFTEAMTAAGLSIDEFSEGDDQLLVFVDAIGKVGDASTRTALLAEAMGAKIGPEFATAALQGKAALEAAGLTLKTVYTPKQLKDSEDYVDAQAEMADAINLVKLGTASLLPFLTDNIDRITAWVGANEELFAQDIPAFLEELAEQLEGAVEFTVDLAEETGNLAREFELAAEDSSVLVDVLGGPLLSNITSLVGSFDDLEMSIRNALQELLGFENAERVIRSFKAKIGIILGPIASELLFGESASSKENAAKREAKEDEADEKAKGDRKEKREADRATRRENKKKRTEADVQRTLGVVGKAEGSKRATKAQKRELGSIRESLAAGQISPAEARAAVASVGVKVGGRGGGGGGKKGKKKKEEKSLDELIGGVTGTSGGGGGGTAPTPNVLINLNIQNNFDNTFNLAAGTPQETAQDIARISQDLINKSNVEASRQIQPLVLR